jgi:hypothetical protein
MWFGPKVDCDQCAKKVKQKQSVYVRGSRFCSDACIATWEAANPPPIATGPEAQLRQELALLLDQALAESGRRTSYNSESQFEVDEVQLAFGQFQSYVLRAAPILRALDFTREAAYIDRTDFQSRWNNGLVQYDVQLLQVLKAVRQTIG